MVIAFLYMHYDIISDTMIVQYLHVCILRKAKCDHIKIQSLGMYMYNWTDLTQTTT